MVCGVRALTVAITKPASGATLTGVVPVEATFNGTNFEIATVTVDGQQLGSDSTKPIAFSVDSAKVADGQHTLTVAVRYRTSGGTRRWQKASIPITTEGNEMNVTLTTSQPAANLEGAVTVTATVMPSSQATGTVRCQWYVNGTYVVTDSSFPLTFAWDTTTVADGNHTLRADVLVRNRSRTATLAVTVANDDTTPPPPPSPPTNLTTPFISGEAEEGMVLTLMYGTWSNSPTSFSQQWTRCDAAGANCVAIPGAIGTTYALTSDDVGDTIRCVVTAYNSGGASPQKTTAQTDVVAAAAGATPTADFSWSPFSPVVGETVTFTAVTNGTLCHWDRTNDRISESGAGLAPGTPFTYAYTSQGTKTMCLQTESAGGVKSSWVCKQLIVEASTPTPPPPTGTTFVYHNPETLTLQPWVRLQTGQPSEVNFSHYVSNVPTGITTPSIVRIVTDPLAQRGKVYELTTTSNSKFRSGSGALFERCDLWQHNGVAWNVQGSEIWENVKIMFPTAWNPGTTGNYGWVYQHHNGAVSVNGVGIVLGIREVTSPHFFLRVPGGNVASPPTVSTYNGPVVQENHWYTIELHIKWSTGSDGFCNFYMDNSLVYSTGPRPTLGYSGTTVDNPNYELSNYHLAVAQNSTIYFDGPKIGTTRGAAYFA